MSRLSRRRQSEHQRQFFRFVELTGFVRWINNERVNKVDYFGKNEITRQINDVIGRIEMPTDLSFLRDLSKTTTNKKTISEWDWCSRYLHYRNLNPITNKVGDFNGRYYYGLTTCPRQIRQRLTLNGCPVGEADLSCSFYVLLAGLLPPGKWRNKAIEWTTSGQWYERLHESALEAHHGDYRTISSLFYAGLTGSDRKNAMKVQTQIQCLFHGDEYSLAFRPLAQALIREIPPMVHLIYQLRRSGGASGLCRFLTTEEGKLMRRAHRELMDERLPFMTNHDGIVLKQDDVERAAHEIRIAGKEYLGFTPLVKAK